MLSDTTCNNTADLNASKHNCHQPPVDYTQLHNKFTVAGTFSVAGAMVWNSLPDFTLVLMITADCFRRLLFYYVFARY